MVPLTRVKPMPYSIGFLQAFVCTAPDMVGQKDAMLVEPWQRQGSAPACGTHFTAIDDDPSRPTMLFIGVYVGSIACACSGFEALAIEDYHIAPPVTDQLARLQYAGGIGDADTAYA